MRVEIKSRRADFVTSGKQTMIYASEKSRKAIFHILWPPVSFIFEKLYFPYCNSHVVPGFRQSYGDVRERQGRQLHYRKKVKDICQHLDLNTKIKVNSLISTKHLQNFKISLTFLCSVYYFNK